VKIIPFHKRQLTIQLKLKKGISKRTKQMIGAYQLKIQNTINDQKEKNESVSGDGYGSRSGQISKHVRFMTHFSPIPTNRYPIDDENKECLPSLKGLNGHDLSNKIKPSILKFKDLPRDNRNIESIMGDRLKSPIVKRSFRIETEEPDPVFTPTGHL
jgi:hypothetical protein